MAEALGEQVAEDEERIVEPAAGEIPGTVHLGLDGTGVPMRKEELAERAGKHPDGSAKTREVKLVCLWTAETRDAKGIPIRDRGSVTYSAAIESAARRDTDPQLSAFAQRDQREARRAASAARRSRASAASRWRPPPPC